MPKQNLTEIICIIDKSGSMGLIKTDAIGGFNEFLKAQKEVPGEALMTVVLFDTDYKFLVEGKNIQDVEPLNERTYVPGGMTALLDAIGKTIDKAAERITSITDENKPGKVIVSILTDGQENSSREYSRKQIFDKIKHQADVEKWQFLFLAANQDAIAEAGMLGINPNAAVNYAATPDGVRSAYASVNAATVSYRTTGQLGDEWKTQK